MNVSDFMDCSDSLLVAGDYYEEHGDLVCWELKAVANLLKQLEAVVGETSPTGSRFYGSYWTASSDWDFFAPCSKRNILTLKDLGWRVPETLYSSASLYRGDVNFIACLTDEEYENVFHATKACKAEIIQSKQQAIEIWDKAAPRKKCLH